MSIRVLIVDDHDVVRSGLHTLMEGTEMEVVADAGDGKVGADLAKELRPDVVLLDVRMPAADGLEALESIREHSPQSRVVMLSTYDNPTYVARSVALGAHDYLSKDCSRTELLSAIRNASDGNEPSEDSMLNRVAGSMQKRSVVSDDAPALTRREHQVLRHLALGLSNREIGRSLRISVETVKEHVQNVLRKLNVSDRTEAAVWAVRRGLA